MTPRLVIALASGTLALAGCGSGDDEDAVRAAVGDYVAALQEADTEAVCSSLSADELAELERSGSCEAVFEAGFELVEEQGIAIPDFGVAEVSVDGASATATVRTGDSEEELPLVREDGAWKLDGATSFADFHPDDPIP